MGRRIPPDFDPQKHKTINGYNNKHALGARARKIGEGILITRFELPFNIWCGEREGDGCGKHIGQGVRFNAEKKKVGNYFSTPIFEFRCKCHECAKQWFTIRTDPQNTRYVVVEGARQKYEEWDPEENGQAPAREYGGDPAEVDPLTAIERDKQNKADAFTTAQRLDAILDSNDDRWSDPYERSRRLRNSFRADKSARQHRKRGDDALKERLGLGEEIQFDVEDEAQIRAASQAWKLEQASRPPDQDRLKRRRIEAEVGARPSSSRALVPSTASGSSAAASKLTERILTTSRHGADPFLHSLASGSGGRKSSSSLGVRRAPR